MKVMKWLAPLAIILAIIVLGLSGRSFVKENSCGCGLISVDTNGEFETGIQEAIFDNKKVDYQLAELTPDLDALKKVLGVSSDEKWIEVDLSDQKLYAKEGDRIIFEFLISSGKFNPTPIGEFRIWSKLKYTRMEGGKKEDNTYYNLPNVPYTQYFYKGYGIHGAYWHNNFGTPMSHGCINMAIPDAEKLFYWSSPTFNSSRTIVYSSKENSGTKVLIHQ